MENNKTQSAVEWLQKELETYGSPQICIVNWEDLDSLIEQAKAMEKEQIMDAYKYGNQSNIYFKPEQYYNETFKSE